MKYLLTLFLLFFPALGFATPASGEAKSVQGLALILNRDYRNAEKIFQELTQKYPKNPAGRLGLMVIDQARMYENFDWNSQQHFEKLASENHRISKDVLNSHDSSLKEIFIAACSLSLESYHEARKDNFIKALKLADSAAFAITRIRERDPRLKEMGDTLLGLGLYDYWKTVAVLKFRFIPMFWLYQDRRQRGLERIQEVIDHGTYLAPVAMLAKTTILLEKNDNAEGIRLAHHFLEKYPKNIIMQSFLGMFFAKSSQWPLALATFEKIHREAPEIRLPFFYRGVIQLAQGQASQALKQFELFRNLGPNNSWTAYALYDEAQALDSLGQSEPARIKREDATRRLSRVSEDVLLFQPRLTTP